MDAFLSGQAIFRTLPSEVRERLPRDFSLKTYQRGESIFEEGDEPSAVYLLREGLVKAVKYSPKTEPFTMEVIVPGGLFGMVAALDKKPYPVSAIPLRTAIAYRIPVLVFGDLLKRHTEFSQSVFKELGGHIRHSQAMRSLYKEPADKRIAYILCVLQESLGKDLQVRREDIAEMTGATTETAVRTLIDFRRQKLIATGWKRISILDPAKLRAYSGVE